MLVSNLFCPIQHPNIFSLWFKNIQSRITSLKLVIKLYTLFDECCTNHYYPWIKLSCITGEGSTVCITSAPRSISRFTPQGDKRPVLCLWLVPLPSSGTKTTANAHFSFPDLNGAVELWLEGTWLVPWYHKTTGRGAQTPAAILRQFISNSLWICIAFIFQPTR